MGCEICRNENRENIDFRLTRDGQMPIELKQKYGEGDNYRNNETYLEEKLNLKYSISPQSLEDQKEKQHDENQLNSKRDELSNNNKNKEYVINTLNIYSNNTIHFGSRNKKKKEKNDTNDNNYENKENTLFETGSTIKKENIKNEGEKKILRSSLKNRNDKNKDKTCRNKVDIENKENNDLTDNKIDKKKNRVKYKDSPTHTHRNKDRDKLKHSHHSHHSHHSNKSLKSHKSHKSHSKDRKKSEEKDKKKNTKKEDKNENEKKLEKKISFSDNEDSQNNDDKSEKKDNKEEEQEEQEDSNNNDDSEDNEDNESEEKEKEKKEKKRKKKRRSLIKYSYTKQISKKTEKINMLLQDIDHSKIDRILNEAPKREKTTLEKLIIYFQKYTKKLSLIERAWLIYKWITENIEYDIEGENSYSYDISEALTFKRGKSICSGYVGLFKKISDNLELTAERIEGFSKVFNFNLEEKIEYLEDSEKHEWNAVQIENEWYLIDTTLGAGYLENEKTYIKKFNPYFFFTPPQEFVRDHLPFESKWQLLPKSKKISQQTFMAFAPLKTDFFTLGFNSIEPDFTFNNVKEKGNFTLYFEKNKGIMNHNHIKVMAKLYLIEDENINKEITNSIMEIRNDDSYEINYLINKKGEYKLKIFGNDGSKKEYNELCTLQLTSEKEAVKYKAYPLTTEFYYNSDIKLIRPNYGVLKEGNKIDFELKCSTYDKLFIGINTNEGDNYIEMHNENNTFIEDEFLIYGKKVMIACKGKNENSYDTIFEFEVLPITKKKSTITHPYVFPGPKNKLIEPICDRLKKGKKVSFSIKCESLEEMAVIDGDDLHPLNKKNNIFSGSVKISGKGDVKIAYKKEDGEYNTLYLYKLI